MKELLNYINNAKLPLMPLLDALPCGVVLADEMGTISYWNHGAEKQFQFLKEEVIGNNLMMLMPDRFVQSHVAAMKKRRDEGICGPSAIVGNTVEIFGRRKDQSEFPVQLSISEHRIGGQRCYMGIICDLADAQMAQFAKMIAMQLNVMNESH